MKELIEESPTVDTPTKKQTPHELQPLVRV
jgi:hypothetical protein